MPRLSDAKGRTVVVYLSMAGSMVAYLLLGLPFMLPGDAYVWLVAGKLMSGLFGGTFPIMLAYIADLTIWKPPHVTKAESNLLRTRTTYAGAMLPTRHTQAPDKTRRSLEVPTLTPYCVRAIQNHQKKQGPQPRGTYAYAILCTRHTNYQKK